jgi:hypothetical protein
VEIENEAELISEAYKANLGGSLPPTPEDTEHTITLLIDQGETQKAIAELLGLPLGMTRRIIKDVRSKVARVRLLAAIKDVIDEGLTIKEAAEKHGAPEEKVKEALAGRRRRQKNGFAEIQRELTFRYKSLSSKNAALMRKVIEMYEDGDLTQDQVRTIIRQVEDLQKKSARAIAGWKARFEGKNRS